MAALEEDAIKDIPEFDLPEDSKRDQGNVTPEDTHKRRKNATKKSSSAKKRERQENLEQIKAEGRRRLRNRGGDLASAMGDMSLGGRSSKKCPDQVGLVYDDMMLGHQCVWNKNHYESPERLKAAYKRCLHYGLVERCQLIQTRLATEEEILSLHSKDLYEKVKSSQVMNDDQLTEHSRSYEDVYFHQKTFDCALMAAGSTIEIVDQVVKDKIRHGMALVRPPGHHAMHDDACGYCFFNNVALAAKHALDDLNVNRILIIDWDVHHGQGTQYLFYDDPRVIYFSIHRYEHGAYWPNLRESDVDYVGDKHGKGYNINVPMNKAGMTNSDYIAVFQQILLPLAYEFCPDLVLVSAGYDIALGCPEGEMAVTPACFAHFVNMLKPLACGKLAVILEGGYCVESLAEGVALSLRALLGDPVPVIDQTQQPDESVKKTIWNVIRALRPYWKCFQFHGKSHDHLGSEVIQTADQSLTKAIVFSTPDNRPEHYEIEDYFSSQTEDQRSELLDQIQRLILHTNLSKAPHRTCLVYDERMRLHKCLTSQSHPERPNRISSIYSAHEEWGLIQRCRVIQSRSATDEELSSVHDLDYIRSIREICSLPSDDLCSMERNYNSIYLSPEAWSSACLSAGCVLAIVDDVLSGNSQSGVAIVRPPGHHAEAETACGFCYFNNVAVAARYAQTKYDLKRILILDWDVHHGNGTQHMFEDDPSVLYISLHRYDNGWFFPIGDGGHHNMTGTGRGEGFNINIAWNGPCMGDAEYITAFHKIVMPVAYEYQPELVIVSAGFDAAKGDPLGGYDVTPEGYAHMTHMLTSLANGKVILALENENINTLVSVLRTKITFVMHSSHSCYVTLCTQGGYNLHSISESMASCTSVLLGDVCPYLPPLFPRRSAVKDIGNVIEVHKNYWKSLFPKGDAVAEVSTEVESDTASSEHTKSSCSGESEDSAEVEFLWKGISDIIVSDKGPDSSTTSSNANEADIKEEEGGATGGSSQSVSQEIKQFLGAAVDGQDEDNIVMYAVTPLPWCPHLDQVQPLPSSGVDVMSPCVECGHMGENWVCLTCYEVHCSRYVNEHMVIHNVESSHQMALSYADLSVWCYGCDMYVHNQVVFDVKRAAHISKFNEDIPGMN